MTNTLREHKVRWKQSYKLANSNPKFWATQRKVTSFLTFDNAENQNVEAEFKFYQSKSSSASTTAEARKKELEGDLSSQKK